MASPAPTTPSQAPTDAEEEAALEILGEWEVKVVGVPVSAERGRARCSNHDHLAESSDLLHLHAQPASPPRHFAPLLCPAQYYQGWVNRCEMVLIEREPTNAYDRLALRVENVRAEKVGHLARMLAAQLSPLVDAGRLARRARPTRQAEQVLDAFGGFGL
jgi:hypothetical protein